MTFTRTLILAAIAAAPLTAQTQLVRGDVDAIRNTVGQFQLDCTTIPLVSTTVNLQALHDASRQQDIEYEMQVRDVGTPARPVLDVVSATAIPEQFQMGNLRFGRAETWEAFAAPGSPVWMLVNHQGGTGYLPFGAAGTWLLGGGALQVAQGVTNPLGRFQVRFTMPNIPALVGQTFVGQAVVQEGGTLSLTNPDCKEVRSN